LTALAAGPKDPDGARIGAGTIAVAAASGVLERTGNSSDQDSANRFTSPTSYVYAALDPASCGHDKAIDCGIVTIDPTSTSAGDRGNLALDPAASVTPDSGPAATRASPQAYRAPMPIPGVPLHIVISGPPASGSQRVTNDPVNPGVPLLNIAPGTGSTTTAAVAMVASSDGHVYWLDLSRWGPPSDLPIARGGVAVTLASSSAVPVGNYQLGLWQDVAPFGSTAFTPAVRTDSVGLISAIDVWPGFTDSDNWTIVYQGALPSLASRQGVLVGTSTGTVAAIQTSTGLVGANIADPSLGVTPGDIVELPGICEARVAAVLPADPTFPGGALQLDLTASGVTCTANQLPPAGASTPTTITVRASGLVLSNSKLGHLGRPVIARPSDAAADTTYAVSWGSTINGGIAADGPGPTSPPLARALARKARRLFYPGADGPCPLTIPNATAEQRQTTGCYGTSRQRITDPLAPGPIIRFRVGLVGPNPSDPTAIPPRDASISFTTSVGLSQTSRKPTTNGVRPGAAIPFDRTARDPAGNAKPQLVGHENDPIFFFVPYLDDQVLVFSTTQSSTQLVSIR